MVFYLYKLQLLIIEKKNIQHRHQHDNFASELIHFSVFAEAVPYKLSAMEFEIFIQLDSYMLKQGMFACIYGWTSSN